MTLKDMFDELREAMVMTSTVSKIRSFIWEHLISNETKDRMVSMHRDTLHNRYVHHLTTIEGLNIVPQCSALFGDHISHEYQFDDIRKDDVVIDLGANIGTFTLRAARLSNHVYAIEPLWADILKTNVALNPDLAPYITVIECALGSGEPTVIEYTTRKREVPTMPLREIIKTCGGCDFLKLDIEGYEFTIPFEEFRGIRRIEMEHHEHKEACFRPNGVKEFLEHNWACTVNDKRNYLGPEAKGWYIHAYPK